MSSVDYLVRVWMPYFHFFVVGSWTFVIGWFVGSIYAQHLAEKAQSSRLSERPEVCPRCQEWRFPVMTSSTSAAD